MRLRGRLSRSSNRFAADSNFALPIAGAGTLVEGHVVSKYSSRSSSLNTQARPGLYPRTIPAAARARKVDGWILRNSAAWSRLRVFMALLCEGAGLNVDAVVVGDCVSVTPLLPSSLPHCGRLGTRKSTD